jgi:FixJ family two-component response regulator
MHAMKKGAVDFLEKPIDDETLLGSIARDADLSRKRAAQQTPQTAPLGDFIA